MGTSKQLIVALERSDWLDRMLILSGIMFFSVVVLFILKQVRVVLLNLLAIDTDYSISV
jgi:hypothetical protein